ncbi:AAA family ATPase [Symmachiella dynata]|uniref:AAA family ATPase n=1 Tax=Symmachiella dynata TaxID=2527995 RepID=UPI0030EBDE41
MRISKVTLDGFKRFHHLTINGLTGEDRFVFLLGPNGSGKSSLFEAFNVCRSAANDQQGFDRLYYLRQIEDAHHFDQKIYGNERNTWREALQKIQVEFCDHPSPHWTSSTGWESHAFHMRGSHRNTPDYMSQNITPHDQLEAFRPSAGIILSTDLRLDRNYQKLVHHGQKAILNPGISSDEESATEAFRLFRKLQESTRRVFPDLTLEGLGDPMGGGTFIFSKNHSTKWRFKNLSAGEKSAFDLLLDLIVTANEVNETVYCIDEPELHMHNQLQSRLMDEIDRIAPPEWQVWLATHSIGMVRWATAKLEEKSNSIAFLDFHGRNFDVAVEINPEKPTWQFWRNQFHVAIGELADLVVPDEIVICEGDGADGFDAKVLQRIFGDTHPRTAFQSAGGCNEVDKAGAILATQLDRLTPGCTVRRLYDRDDRTDTEMNKSREAGNRILSVREIENYIFDFEVIELFVRSEQQEVKWDTIKSEIDEEIASLEGEPRNKTLDDIKSAAPKIRQILKTHLALTQAGSNYYEFALEHLVPLITSSTEVYRRLERDIWPPETAKEESDPSM